MLPSLGQEPVFLICMICSFACPVDGLITFKEMPKTYKRADTVTLGKELESQLKG